MGKIRGRTALVLLVIIVTAMALANALAWIGAVTYNEQPPPGYQETDIRWVTPLYSLRQPLIFVNDEFYYFQEYESRVLATNGTVIGKLPAANVGAVASDGSVALFGSDTVQFLNPDGSTRWTADTGPILPWLALPTIGPHGEVYAATDSRWVDGGFDGLIALDDEGAELWEYHTALRVWHHINVAWDGTIVFATSWPDAPTGNIIALHPNGTLRWSVEVPTTPYGIRVTVAGDDVFAFADGNTLMAFDLDGTPKWSMAGLTKYGDVIVKDDVVLVSNGSLVTCLDRDGVIKWSYDAGDEVFGMTFFEGGDVLVTTTTELQRVSAGGDVEWKSRVASRTIPDMTRLHSPMVDSKGQIYVQIDEGGHYNLVAFGDAPVQSGVAGTSLMLNLLFVASSILAAAVWSFFIYRAYKKGGVDFSDQSERHPLLTASLIVRLVGVGMGFVALFYIWQYQTVGSTFFFPGGYPFGNGWTVMAVPSLGLQLFIAGLFASLFTWYASYLAMTGLLVYAAQLSGLTQHSLFLGAADLSQGVPYGDGYLIAWAAVVVLLASGLLRLLSLDDVGEPKVSLVGGWGS